MGTDGWKQDWQISHISWKDDMAFEITTGHTPSVRVGDHLVLRYS